MQDRVRTSFGKFWKLWKLTVPFSRIWIVLEKGGFSKWLWNSFGFYLEKFLNISKWM